MEQLNSTNDEISPFVKDGILYFSSNRNNSFGGYDIYHTNNFVSLKPTIANVGSSVNNQNDQTSIFIYEDMILQLHTGLLSWTPEVENIGINTDIYTLYM